MTIEEAIQILNDWDGYFIGHGSDDVTEALGIAIKSLEAWEKVKNICTIQVADTFRNFEEYDRGSHAREKIRSTCSKIAILLKEVSE